MYVFTITDMKSKDIKQYPLDKILDRLEELEKEVKRLKRKPRRKNEQQTKVE